MSLVDFNRSGAPLMEIVTDPDIRTAEQARRYAEELQLLLRTIGASDADMERGQMRVEANVSLRARGTEAFGTRVEVKNMNSFRSVERAIEFEIDRQAAALDAGEPLAQETRGWSDDRGETYHMRSKETSDDYRYFPEPDLPPLHVDRAWLDALRAGLPELPAARRARYQASLGLGRLRRRGARPPTPTRRRCSRRRWPPIRRSPPKSVANWVTGEYLRLRNSGRGGHARRGRRRPSSRRSSGRSRTGRISRANAKEVFEAHVSTGEAAAAIIAARGLRQISDSGAVGAAVDEVLAANPAAVADYRAGKVQAVGFLVGQVMKATRGQANAALVQAAVRERLDRRGVGERMGPINLLLWGAGVALVVIGYTRARGPWARYQALKAQDENVARYESWRGGLRNNETTGASVAMAILRRQAQVGATIAIVGVVLIFLGFLLR